MQGLAISPDGSRIYAANEQVPGSVSIVDTTRNVVAATVPLGGPEPVGVVLSPDGRRAYVTVGQNTGPFLVAVLDTARRAVTATIPVGDGPTLPAITPDGRRLFVPNSGSGTVSVIDTADNRVVATVETGAGFGTPPRSLRMAPACTRRAA